MDNFSDSETETQVSIKPKKELRSQPLKSSLKCFVTDYICKYYEVASIRALLKSTKQEIWEIRQVLEQSLRKDNHIVGFFSCGTAIEQKIGGEKKGNPGLAFWVMFDWPECSLNAYEAYLSKLFIKTGLDLLSCKAIKGRSKFFFLSLKFDSFATRFYIFAYHSSLTRYHTLSTVVTRCPFYHSFSKTQHFEIESEKFQKFLSQNPSCLSHAIPAYHSLSLLSLIF